MGGGGKWKNSETQEVTRGHVDGSSDIDHCEDPEHNSDMFFETPLEYGK